MLAMQEAGKSHKEIAAGVGVHLSTVYDTLNEWQDVRDLARKKLEASSLQVAERAITQSDPLKLLEGIGVIEGSKSGAPQILIAIGAPSSPLSPPVITLPRETSKK
jgi:hypothetical protein